MQYYRNSDCYSTLGACNMLQKFQANFMEEKQKCKKCCKIVKCLLYKIRYVCYLSYEVQKIQKNLSLHMVIKYIETITI